MIRQYQVVSITWNQKNGDPHDFPEQTQDSGVSDGDREWSWNTAMYFALHINQLVLSRKQKYADVDDGHLKETWSWT
jgi:hypothetical protein